VELLASDGGADHASAGQSIRIDGASVPGFLTIKPIWNEAPAKFDVIATMPIESYLPGVLVGEIPTRPQEWPRQTYEAQSVAARTYALHERGRARREGRAVDVESTTDDQVYHPVKVPAIVDQAVRATRGQVLLERGQLLRAYFSSQCGGRPASAADIWPTRPGWEFNKAGPIQGKPRQHYCQRSPLFRWEVVRSDDDVNRRVRAWGKATTNDVARLTRLRSVEVASRNAAERPNRYRLTDGSGDTYELRAEELRNALNHPVADLAAITRENRVNSGDVEVEVWANQVRISGRGWGHGVGMCQYCAKGMGEAAMDWHTMLTAFYPGVEVRKVY
jgi:stage II sporulation protein D